MTSEPGKKRVGSTVARLWYVVMLARPGGMIGARGESE
jgi:hypothetical protein